MNNLNKVTVTANPNTGLVFNLTRDEQGNPKLDKNGEQHGTIRVEQKTFNPKYIYLNGGVEVKSALIGMLAKSFDKVKDFYTPGLQIEGKIRTIETNDVNIHKNGINSGFQIKKAGSAEDAEILVKNGQPIYRTTRFVSVNSPEFNEQDLLVEHDNKIVRVVKPEIKLEVKEPLN